jgi:hypothetical protein
LTLQWVVEAVLALLVFVPVAAAPLAQVMYQGVPATVEAEAATQVLQVYQVAVVAVVALLWSCSTDM